MAIDRSYTRVRQEERQSTKSLIFVWVGIVVCAPALMIGAILTSSFSFGEVIFIIATSYILLCGLMVLNGVMACETGYPLTVLLGKTFGEKGSRYLIASLTAIFQLVQSSIQTAVCAASICAGLSVLGIDLPFLVSGIFCAVVITLTAVFGYDSMKWLGYIAVPFLVLTCLWACVASGTSYGWENLLAFRPERTMSWADGYGMTLGTFALGTMTTTNLTRFAKSRKGVAISSFLGIIPAAVIFMGMGSLMSITAGTYDLTEIFVKLNMPIVGMLALLLATWTTNTTNFYMSGINFVRLFNLPETKRPHVTAIACAFAAVLTLAGIMNYFSDVMTLFGKVFPALCGIMVADYWVIGHGKIENWGMVPGWNWVGVAAWAIGAAVGLFFNFFSPAINSLIVGFAAYLVLHAIFKSSIPPAQDPVDFFGAGDEMAVEKKS